MFIPLRKAKERLGLHGDTLRRYADNGIIKSIRTHGGKRLFEIDDYLKQNGSQYSVVCYCRVSSPKQKDDLQRQIEFMQSRYPDAEIIKDIGSGINYQRKGLNALLERALSGDKLRIVVAHKDRLARFGYELIEFIIKQQGGEVVVLDKTDLSPEQELTQDILQILHVFSCRINGMRKYRDKIKEDKDIPKCGTE